MSTLIERAAAILLASPEKKFTGREISQVLIQKYPEMSKKKLARSQSITNESDLVAQYAAEISASRRKLQIVPNIRTTEDRPRRFYYSEMTELEEVAKAEDSVPDAKEVSNGEGSTPAQKTKEHSLYPKLCEYLKAEFKIYGKRIDEKKASNMRGAGGNHWLFPDVVGIQDLTLDWKREIKDCVAESGDKRLKIWSFEVKVLLNRSNVRQCFFQAVSNCSWANFGYLVACEVEDEAMKELRILNSLHGVGIIRLDEEAPTESEVLLQAAERSVIDWHTANRITRENPDFQSFAITVREFYQTGTVHI